MSRAVFQCASWEVNGEQKFSTKQVQTALGIGHRTTFIQDRAQFGYEALRSLTLAQVKDLLQLRLFIRCGGNHPDFSRANFNRLFSGNPTQLQGQAFSSLSAVFESKQISVEQEFQTVLEVLNGRC